VLPIGGLKEKVLAAHREGIKNIIIPKENEKDLQDIPAEVRESLKIDMVETMDQVLQLALVRPLTPVGSEINETFTPVVDGTKVSGESITQH